MLNDGLFTIPNNLPFNVESIFPEFAESTESSTLIFEITQAYDLRCRYCAYSGAYKNHRVHSNEVISKEIAFAAIDLFATQVKTLKSIIGFYCGEPLIETLLIYEIIKYSSNKLGPDVKFSLTTNGTYLTVEIRDTLTKYNKNILITVSLDGPTPVHDQWRRMRNGSESHTVITDNLRLVQLKYPQFYENNNRFHYVPKPPFYYNQKILVDIKQTTLTLLLIDTINTTTS